MIQDWLTHDLGIDLGTTCTRVSVRRQGTILQEPTIIALEADTQQVLATGQAAAAMVGRTPPHVVTVSPLQTGTVTDLDAAALMLRTYLRRLLPSVGLFRPRAAVTTPAAATEVQQRAVRSVLRQAGLRRAVVVPSPLAAALGAGLPVTAAQGSMVVALGGGITEAAVLSLGRIVVSRSLPVAGNSLDRAVQDYLNQHYGLLVSRQAAEQIKLALGSAVPPATDRTLRVQGQDRQTRLPRAVTVTAAEVYAALQEQVGEIVQAVEAVLAAAPSDLTADLQQTGIMLTGGGALLPGLGGLLRQRTGVPVMVADEPQLCSITGLARLLAKPRWHRMIAAL